MHDSAIHFLLLCPQTWVFPGDPLLPLVHWWCHRYVILLPAEAPPLLDESSNQEPSLPWHIFAHALYPFWKGYSHLHSSSSFCRRHISCSQYTSTHNMLHTYTHTFKVSACFLCMPHQPYSHSNILHASIDVCMHRTNLNLSLLLKMVDWTFEDALVANTKPAFHTSISLAKHGWPWLGGHMLCKNPHYHTDVMHTVTCSPF